MKEIKSSGFAEWALKLFLKNRNIKQIKINKVILPKKVQDRFSSNKFINILEKVLNNKKINGFPFWENFNQTIISEKNISKEIIDAILFHNGCGKQYLNLSEEDIKSGKLNHCINFKSDNEILVLSSKVLLKNNKYMHVPMMDFSCDVGINQENIVKQMCAILFQNDFDIFISGASYHAYSTKLLSGNERIVFLGKALLLSPIVDKQYIAHQLMQKESCLRISDRHHKKIRMI